MREVNSNGYSVKGIKSFIGMEGLGFNATLYKDNRKIAFLIDEGCGGEVIFQFVNRDGKDEKELKAHCATLPKIKFDGHDLEMDMDMGWFVTELVSKYEADQKMKRACKNYTCYRLKTDPEDKYWRTNQPYTPLVKSALIAKYGKNLLEIINERYV